MHEEVSYLLPKKSSLASPHERVWDGCVWRGVRFVHRRSTSRIMLQEMLLNPNDDRQGQHQEHCGHYELVAYCLLGKSVSNTKVVISCSEIGVVDTVDPCSSPNLCCTSSKGNGGLPYPHSTVAVPFGVK